jgi:hypothetical protein
MPGREKCSGDSTTIVEVSEVNPLTGYRTPIYTQLVTFMITDAGLVYDLSMKDLTPGTTYNIEVRASYNTNDALEKTEIAHTDESDRTITTKELSSFNLNWESHQGTTDVVIKADGTTVVNVRFDRNVINMNFTRYTYTVAPNNNGTQYGIVNNSYVELRRRSNFFSYYWQYFDGNNSASSRSKFSMTT